MASWKAVIERFRKFSVLFLFFGTGLVLYVLLWIFIPKEPGE
jgi:phage shock protein PspC (stress-responsive transcriptional regulator)